MSLADDLVLFIGGIGGGLSGSIAGLASLISYPVLLAVGLPPVTANVTNTIALVFSSAGSITGSRPELVGQRHRIRELALVGMVGGAAGAALLLLTPSDSFERIVPWLVALASIALLLQPRLMRSVGVGSVRPTVNGPNDDVSGPEGSGPDGPVGPVVLTLVGLVGVYAGYFGAGAGVMMLALMLLVSHETLPRSNAVKNVVLGLANGVAAVGFVVFGPVRWSVVAPLGIGLFIGGHWGPWVVRRLPAGPLRVVIALAGLGLAVSLGLSASN